MKRRFCECGCGKSPNPGMRFLNGHNRRGIPHTAVANEKNRLAHLGKKHQEGCLCSVCKLTRGEVAWEDHPRSGKRHTRFGQRRSYLHER